MEKKTTYYIIKIIIICLEIYFRFFLNLKSCLKNHFQDDLLLHFPPRYWTCWINALRATGTKKRSQKALVRMLPINPKQEILIRLLGKISALEIRFAKVSRLFLLFLFIFSLLRALILYSNTYPQITHCCSSMVSNRFPTRLVLPEMKRKRKLLQNGKSLSNVIIKTRSSSRN